MQPNPFRIDPCCQDWKPLRLLQGMQPNPSRIDPCCPDEMGWMFWLN